jgi:benzoyl-CoA reductase subunit C
MKWFIDEITSLKKRIEEHFKQKITHDALNASILEYNKGRQLMRELESLRTRSSIPISGTDAFAISIAGTSMPREDFNTALSDCLEDLKQQSKSKFENCKRLMVIGSISDDLELVGLIESNGDAVVVADNLCFGVRHDASEIPQGDHPLEELAESYLGSSTCPRMFGKYKERLAILKDKVAAYSVDGVVLQNIRFCDLHGSENGLFERDLEKEGIPCLKLEREYGPLTDTGRLKMRLDAFMERISYET